MGATNLFDLDLQDLEKFELHDYYYMSKLLRKLFLTFFIFSSKK